MSDLTAWIISGAAAVAGVIYMFGRIRQGFRKLDKLDELLDKLGDLEDLLTTMNEDVPRMAVALGLVQASVEELKKQRDADRHRLRRIVLLGARHHPDAADEYLREDHDR